MIAFMIAKGTPINAVKNGEWMGNYFEPRTTTKDLMFFLEDLRIDPLGAGRTLACAPGDVTIGGAWARAGFYGFAVTDPTHRYAMILVSHQYVKVG